MLHRISILGCGWLGFALAMDLKQKGYEVNGSTTSTPKIKQLKEAGIRPFLVDISSINSDVRGFLAAEVLIIVITSKNIDHYRRLIEIIENSELKKVLFISSTSVYPNSNGIVTESSPTLLSPLVEIEDLFLSNPNFQSTVIRFGGLFGYDRKPGNFIRSKEMVDNPEAYINFIHRDDCIAIIEQIILQNAWGEVFNACSDSHPKRRDFYRQEARKVGIQSLVFNEKAKNDYKLISSEKLKRKLAYSFKYSELIEGSGRLLSES